MPSGMVYTLAKAATMNKINTEACLVWVLGRIPDHPVNRIDDL
jgi:transposase